MNPAARIMQLSNTFQSHVSVKESTERGYWREWKYHRLYHSTVQLKSDYLQEFVGRAIPSGDFLFSDRRKDAEEEISGKRSCAKG